MNGFDIAPLAVLFGYCLLVLIASLAGGWILLEARLVHARLQTAISFVAGLMLGMALLHFIPHAYHQHHSVDQTVQWALGGFLVMFFLQRFFQYHHHDVPQESEHSEHAEHAEHSEDAEHGHKKPVHWVSWAGVALGLSLHSLLDGLAMAVAVAVDAQGHGRLLGLGAALAVILHKPFDAMAVSTLTTASGCSRFWRHTINILFALVSPLGAVLFFFGASQLGAENMFVGWALAFCAGTFLCVACTDLLPELQFHSHDRIKLSLALIAGIAIAILIGQFESSGHDHNHPGEESNEQHSALSWIGRQ